VAYLGGKYKSKSASQEQNKKQNNRRRTVTNAPSEKNWQKIYEAAVFEPDSAVLLEKIDIAQKAIHMRVRELNEDRTGSDLRERQQLADALRILQSLLTIENKDHRRSGFQARTR
jgi:hypothetical protein